MIAVPSGWWRDEVGKGIAHFYDQADALDSELRMIWTKCGIENTLDDPRSYLALPDDDDEARPFVDMGDCSAKACPACLKALTEQGGRE